jgi:putative endonuclease
MGNGSQLTGHSSRLLTRFAALAGFPRDAKTEAFERYLKSGSGHAFANQRLW